MSTTIRLSARLFRVIFALLLFVHAVVAAEKRVFYVTASYGFRHSSLEQSAQTLTELGTRTGLFQLVQTEDVSTINADSLKTFDAVLFFTTGELPLSDAQKKALLDWISAGGSFGGFHSATDTLYSWPAYGELIGGYFDGHPWTQEARVLITDPTSPITAGLPTPWTLTEEYYQFRDLSPIPKVLLSLDTTSVDLNAPGVKAQKFPLAWLRDYGKGRVFYTALGHFEGTWTSPVFGRLLENAMRYLLGSASSVSVDAVGNAASMTPLNVVAPGSIVSIYGRGLSGGTVSVNDAAGTVYYTSDTQINARIPAETPGPTAAVKVSNAAGAVGSRQVDVRSAVPGIFIITADRGTATLWVTGLGSTDASAVAVTIAGQPARLLYAGPAPGFPGLDQVNVELTPDTPRGRQHFELSIRSDPAARAVADADLPQ